MPKAKKTKKKRVITCGKCKVVGHNARTCTAKTEAKKGSVVKSTMVETRVELPDPPTKKRTRIDTSEREERPRREAPTADRGTAATAAPYRCQKCNAVSILAIVRVKDHMESHRQGKTVYKGDTRCESCLNKPDPAELIMVWGASPDQVVSAAVANAATED